MQCFINQKNINITFNELNKNKFYCKFNKPIFDGNYIIKLSCMNYEVEEEINISKGIIKFDKEYIAGNNIILSLLIKGYNISDLNTVFINNDSKENAQVSKYIKHSDDSCTILFGCPKDKVDLSSKNSWVIQSNYEKITLKEFASELKEEPVIKKHYVTNNIEEQIVNFCFETSEEIETLNIKIYNIKGEVVKIISKKLPGASAKFTWDGRNNNGIKVASGIYFAKMDFIFPDKKISKNMKLFIVK